MSSSTSRISRVAPSAALLALLFLTLHWSRPLHNWDMVAYIAVAHKFSGASPEEVHRATYRTVRENVGSPTYTLLVEGNDYRRSVAGDPAILDQQLPLYQVKPVYPWLIQILQALGLNGVDASLVISRAAYLVLGIIVMIWLTPMLGQTSAVVVAWMIMSLPFVLQLANLSTPDALSTAIIVAALWLAFERERCTAGTLLLLPAMLVRPDNGLWLVAVASGCAWTKRITVKSAIAAVLAGIAVYVPVTVWAGTNAWSSLLYYQNFVEKLSSPSGVHVLTAALQRLRMYLRETHPANLPSYTLLFVLLGAAVFVSRLRSYGKRDRWLQLLATCAAFAGLHWIVYPDEDRFLVTVYLVVLVAVVRTLVADRLPNRSTAA